MADWWLKQDAQCPVCGPQVLYDKAPTRIKGRSNESELVIDHDHQYTRKDYRNNSDLLPRGILCHRHNLALGMAKENKEELKRMIDYIKKLPDSGSKGSKALYFLNVFKNHFVDGEGINAVVKVCETCYVKVIKRKPEGGMTCDMDKGTM